MIEERGCARGYDFHNSSKFPPNPRANNHPRPQFPDKDDFLARKLGGSNSVYVRDRPNFAHRAGARMGKDVFFSERKKNTNHRINNNNYNT